MRFLSRPRCFVSLAAGILAAGPALAVDGVREINQAAARAGGITPTGAGNGVSAVGGSNVCRAAQHAGNRCP